MHELRGLFWPRKPPQRRRDAHDDAARDLPITPAGTHPHPHHPRRLLDKARQPPPLVQLRLTAIQHGVDSFPGATSTTARRRDGHIKDGQGMVVVVPLLHHHNNHNQQ